MIKIDSAKFDWDLLNEVYIELTDKIEKGFFSFKKKNHNKVLITNFEKFFNESKDKTLSLQLKEDFIKEINEYHEMYEILQWNKNIEDIIGYDLLSSEQRNKILTAMNISTCPYCNRQYISLWQKNDIMKSTADIDHFFIKSKYPIVSLCLHNFVPCCHVCNSRFKLDTDFYKKIHIYPYEEGYGQEGRFVLDNIDYLYGNIPQFSIHIQGDEIQREKIINSVQTFKIDEIYRNHSNYVEDLIRQVQVYSCSQVEELYNAFNGMFNSIDEVKQMAFSNYCDSDKYIEHPLSKLTSDILEDLGVDI